MKKILSFLIVLGAITFINIDLFASEYQGITLDSPIAALNNETLRDVYETYNLATIAVSNQDGFSSAWSSITIDNNGFIHLANGQRTYPYFTLYKNGQVFLTVPNDTYYINATYYTDDVNAYNIVLNIGNNNNFFTTTYNQETFVSSKGTPTNTSTITYQFLMSTLDNTTSVYFNNLTIIDLTYYFLDNVSQATLDYYYQLYKILKLGLSPDVFYTQGSAVGYGNGLEDYHNGFYNYLDPTTGVPYTNGYNNGLNDGFDNGYIAGEQVGYNDGMDYAATNNLTLLSIFELIIGVVINMLTFIITIEVFGISILSLLSTAALLVGVVWILKLVRG